MNRPSPGEWDFLYLGSIHLKKNNTKFIKENNQSSYKKNWPLYPLLSIDQYHEPCFIVGGRIMSKKEWSLKVSV